MLLTRRVSFIVLITVVELSMASSEAKGVTNQQYSYTVSGRSITFPSEDIQKQYNDSGMFITKNILTTRMQFFKHKIIVTQPRYKAGVPTTLGILNMISKEGHMAIKAFPSWSMQEEGNCDAIQSAVDLYIDSKHTLWVLDAGNVHTLENPQHKCQPKIVAMSMTTNRVMQTIDLTEYITESSDLQYIVAENSPDGKDYVYISDVGGKSLIMLEPKSNSGKRFVLPAIVNEECKNALYLMLVQRGGDTILYFTTLDGAGIYSLSTSLLKQNSSRNLVQRVGIKSEGIVLCGTDRHSKIFYRRKKGNDIFVWHVGTPFPAPEYWLPAHQGDAERVTTHVTVGPWGYPWIMESNVKGFIENCAVCPEPTTKIFPILGNM